MGTRRLAAAACLALAACWAAPRVVEPPPPSRTVNLRRGEFRDPGRHWLAERQEGDGAWERGDPSATALAVLSFLYAGYTNRSGGWQGKTVGDGLAWLKRHQTPEGTFGPPCVRGALRRDALATVALVEVYGLTGSALWPEAARRGLDSLTARRRCWIPARFPASDEALETLAWGVCAFMDVESIARWQKKEGREPVLHSGSAVLQEARAALSAMRREGAVLTPMAVAVRAYLTSLFGSGKDHLDRLASDLATLADLLPHDGIPGTCIPPAAVVFGTRASRVRGLGEVFDRWTVRAMDWCLDKSRWTSVEETSLACLAEPPICSAYLPAFPETGRD